MKVRIEERIKGRRGKRIQKRIVKNRGRKGRKIIRRLEEIKEFR